MSGKLLADTNIVMYLLSGNTTLATVLQDKETYVSFVTELELLSYHQLKDEERELISDFLAQCTIVNINEKIKRLTITLRSKYRLKLPDAIIMATAMHLKLPFLTPDKGLEKVEEIDIIVYQP